MKILQIIPNLKKGGAERLVLDICRQLSLKKEVVVKLIVFSDANDYSFLMGGIEFEVISVRVIPSIIGKPSVDVNRLQNCIDTFQPDIVHSHLFETEMVLAHISFPTHTKRVVHFHDNIKQLRNLSMKSLLKKSFLTDFYEKRIFIRNLSKKAKLICISKDTFEFAKKVMPNSLSKSLLHNAVDLSRFHPIRRHSRSNEITIIGSLVDKKGQELAIQCISELKNRNIITHLNIIGDGPNRQDLTNQIELLGLNNLVTLHGKIDFSEDFLQKSDLYLHTAKYEPFGLVLVEAMGCGLPIVCTDGKGNRDLICEGENGFMIWERKPKLLADKIEILLKNDTLRAEMGVKAREFSLQFAIEKYVESLLKLYKNN
jgi:glycosyltransferase involved in cell wall biosynthesis